MSSSVNLRDSPRHTKWQTQHAAFLTTMLHFEGDHMCLTKNGPRWSVFWALFEYCNHWDGSFAHPEAYHFVIQFRGLMPLSVWSVIRPDQMLIRWGTPLRTSPSNLMIWGCVWGCENSGLKKYYYLLMKPVKFWRNRQGIRTCSERLDNTLNVTIFSSILQRNTKNLKSKIYLVCSSLGKHTDMDTIHDLVVGVAAVSMKTCCHLNCGQYYKNVGSHILRNSSWTLAD